VITGDDILHSKPAPDSYCECVLRFCVEPQQAIVVEDAVSGIESAKAAGLDVIAVNNPELEQTREYAGTLAEICQALRP
jgi:beta-phosphoglucomutase-like phosphatase (HAD superfamily)